MHELLQILQNKITVELIEKSGRHPSL